MKRSTKVTTLLIILPLCLFLTSMVYFSMKFNELKLNYQSTERSFGEDKNTDNDLLKEKLHALEDKVDELNETIMALNKRMASNERDHDSHNFITGQNTMNLAKLEKIVDNLPQLTKKLAFVTDESASDAGIALTLDYVEWFSGEEAERAAIEDNDENAASISNGFYIRNTQIENDKVVISSETLLFVLDGPVLKHADFGRFLDGTDSLRDRLFHVYSIDKKVLIFEEQYRP